MHCLGLGQLSRRELTPGGLTECEGNTARNFRIGTGLAFALMGRLVGRVGGTRAAFATYLVPVVALILGTVLRDEVVAAAGVAGIAMVIAGAALASRPDRPETSV